MQTEHSYKERAKKESISEASPTLGRVSEAAAISFHSLQFIFFLSGSGKASHYLEKKHRQALLFSFNRDQSICTVRGGRNALFIYFLPPFIPFIGRVIFFLVGQP